MIDIDALVARARAAAQGAEAELEPLDETAGALRALAIVRAAGSDIEASALSMRLVTAMP